MKQRIDTLLLDKKIVSNEFRDAVHNAYRTTLCTLADNSGICRTTLSMILNGKRQVSKGDPRIRKIAELIGFTGKMFNEQGEDYGKTKV